MNTSKPLAFADLDIRSIFSRVLFSITLAPTASQLVPCTLSTSFCGSMNTTAVPIFCTVIPDDWSVICGLLNGITDAHWRWSVERPPVNVASRPYEALLGQRRGVFFRGEPGICTTIKDRVTR